MAQCEQGKSSTNLNDGTLKPEAAPKAPTITRQNCDFDEVRDMIDRLKSQLDDAIYKARDFDLACKICDLISEIEKHEADRLKKLLEIACKQGDAERAFKLADRIAELEANLDSD